MVNIPRGSRDQGTKEISICHELSETKAMRKDRLFHPDQEDEGQNEYSFFN